MFLTVLIFDYSRRYHGLKCVEQNLLDDLHPLHRRGDGPLVHHDLGDIGKRIPVEGVDLNGGAVLRLQRHAHCESSSRTKRTGCLIVNSRRGRVSEASWLNSNSKKAKIMTNTQLIILIVVLFLLFGGGGGYYFSRRGR